jgi:carbonic anhydrase
MARLSCRRTKFVEGLVKNAGWDMERADDYFSTFAPMFEIGNEIDFVSSEAQRLRIQYPGLSIAPLFYTVETNRLSLVKEES